ncbi:DeoR/GlpR family DNA-binding transcription regulator [Caviibacter abscessus]|uniref:DeoR/GlpR family DNA-binding transcription regulator n=1 Tax=Caviibacter abscessus TaxID=1766719 RepID=UPI0008321A2E|nr:DeoR/GlpR family DNA-binding transcription regulator [Caviibacter abscessus]
MKRRDQILDLIVSEGKISVVDLAEKMRVSQVTIRKDLDYLVSKGLITREYGYALTLSNDDISNRLVHNYSIKLKIAKLAAQTVSDGEIIMIESGSTCALLAEELCKTKKNIKIITNSIFIANFLREYRNVDITILGGEFQSISQVNTGPITRLCAEQYMVDKLFLGVDGFDEKFGFFGADILRTYAVKDMSECAKKVIVLTTSEKFKERGLVKLFKPEEVYAVYTDCSTSEKVIKFLREQNIEVNIAK